LIAGSDCADPAKTQFFDQAILQGLVGTLDAAFRLWRVGAKNVDVERVQRPSELSHAVAIDGTRAIASTGIVLSAGSGGRGGDDPVHGHVAR
jgi:hypothetical protein